MRTHKNIKSAHQKWVCDSRSTISDADCSVQDTAIVAVAAVAEK